MKNYTISSETLAVIPINKKKSKIYETDNVIIIEKSAKKIIEENCKYYGSSYEGRRKGTVELIGITHKSPIIIEDSNDIIFFPTCSPRIKECGWISLNNVENYKAFNKNSLIIFNNNLKLEIPVSNKIINNQILKATRLESVMNKRRKKIQN